MEFFRTRILFHTHVEKAAGTTLVDGLKTSLGADHVLDLRSPLVAKPRGWAVRQKAVVWALTGHFHYGSHERAFSRPKLYIGTVRPPLDRFRSYVSYVRQAHPAFQFVDNKPFGQVVEEYLDARRPQANNQMSRIFTGAKIPPTDAIKNIERNYLFVAPYRRVNEALDALVKLVGAESVPHLHRNKGSRMAGGDIGALEERFNRANSLDIDLCQYVEENFDRWLATMAARCDEIVARRAISRRLARLVSGKERTMPGSR